MKIKHSLVGLLLASLVVFSYQQAALAHLDTLTQVLHLDPLVKTFEAETTPAVGEISVVEDAKATGGKYVLTDSEGDGFKLDFGRLSAGIYAVYVCARVSDDDGLVSSVDAKRLAGSSEQTKPVYFQLTVNSGVGGKVEQHRMRVPFSGKKQFEYVAKIYFHAPEERGYEAELTVAHGTLLKQLHIDRVELRNPLGNLSFKRVKQKRILYGANQIRSMRTAAAKEGTLPDPIRAQPLSDQERSRRDEIIWNQSLMPINANPGQIYGMIGRGNEHLAKVLEKKKEEFGKDIGKWKFAPNMYDRPWVITNAALDLKYTLEDYNAGRTLPSPWPIPEDKAGYFFDKDKWGLEVSFNYGFIPLAIQQRYHSILVALGATKQGRSHINDLPNRYLLLGDLEAAADAAFLLAGYAYRYPAYEWNTSCMINIVNVHRTFNPGNVRGRGCSYQGWSTGEIIGLVEAYDKLFPYIDGNEQLAKRIGRFVPWVKTPDDVIRLIDTFLVQRSAQDAVQHILYSRILPAASVVLGPGEVSEKYLNKYFNERMYLRDTLSGFADAAIGGMSPDGLNYIGSTFYTVGESLGEVVSVAKLMRRYISAGGNRKFAFGDPRQWPRIGATADSILRLHVAGGHDSGVGDVGDPIMVYRPHMRLSNAKPIDFFIDSWRRSKDPRLAWYIVNKGGQRDLSAKEWAAVQQQAEQSRDPLLHTQSHVLESYGIASLEENVDATDPKLKQATMMRFGVGSGHAHSDTLDLELYAFGLRMSSDLGGRSSGRYGRPNCMKTNMHNLVEVDEASHNGGPQNSTAIGWVESFNPQPGAQYIHGASRAESHPQVSRYSRGVMQVVMDYGNGKDTPTQGYVFDVFRVKGGKIHTWNFHGCVSEDFQINTKLDAASSDTALKYMHRHHKPTLLEGKSNNALTATWTLRRTVEEVHGIKLPNAELKMLGKDRYDPDSPMKHTRVTLFGQTDQHVMVGDWYANKMSQRMHTFPMLHVRKESDSDDLTSVYPAIIEPFMGESKIKSARQIEIKDAGDGVDRPVAVEVRTAFGQTDYLFAAGRGSQTVKVTDDVKASGEVAFASFDNNGLRLLHLVGGTELKARKIHVQLDQPEYRTSIQGANYKRQSVTLATSLPGKLLDGSVFTVSNDAHKTTRKVTKIAGNTMVFDRTSLYYRGGVEYLNEQEGYVELDLAPYLQSYHPDFYTGMTVVNEKGHVLGRARIELGDRFFYTGFPEARRHLAHMSDEDITDANGDGKRTVAMIVSPHSGTTGAKKFAEDGETLIHLKPGEKMFDLEVSRIRDDGYMLFTKQHPRIYLDALKLPHPGWPYHQQIIRNEAGTKEWFVNMPGDIYRLFVDGRKLKKRDVPDADGDGRAMLYLHDYGVNDEATIATHAYLRRQSKGVYELRANVGLTLTLPGNKAEVSTNVGESFDAVAEVKKSWGNVTFKLGAEQLGDGNVTLRVE